MFTFEQTFPTFNLRISTMQHHQMAKLRSLPDVLLQKSPYYILAVVYVFSSQARLLPNPHCTQ